MATAAGVEAEHPRDAYLAGARAAAALAIAVAGLGAAALALWLRAPVLVAVVLAAVVTGGLRALG